MINRKADFRYDIAALRTIAVLGVILFHYKFQFLKGGYAGVDIFFLISGYLMSNIIISAIEQNTFSYRTFIIRRAQRIIPALFFLVSVITIAGFFIYFPWDFKLNSGNALASLLFYSNILYTKNTGYFSPSSETNIFLHTWSLSLEWQFYLIYPFLLIFLNKVCKKRLELGMSLGILSMLFFAISIHYTSVQPLVSFYSLMTRSWELMLGGLVFLIEGIIIRPFLRRVFLVTGVLLLLYSLIFLNNTMAWPGYYTLLPVLGTCLIIVSSQRNSRIWRLPGVQFLGSISYSLYLWHWPVFVIAMYLGVELTVYSKILFMLLSLGLASISFYLIERRKFENYKILIPILALGMVLVLGFNKLTINQFIFKRKALSTASYLADHLSQRNKQFSEGKCFISTNSAMHSKFDKLYCLHIDSRRKNILLMGDSHAADLSQSFRELLASRNINLLQSTASGCLPLLKNHGLVHCTNLMDYTYATFIAKNSAKIDGVILTANWVLSNYDQETLIKDLTATIHYLQTYHLKIIVIGQSECYTIPYPIIRAREVQYNSQIRKQYLDKDAAEINSLLKHKFPALYVNIYNADSIPGLKIIKVPYLSDENHFSKEGADIVARKVCANSFTGALIN